MCVCFLDGELLGLAMYMWVMTPLRQQQKHVVHTHTHTLHYLWDERLDADGSCHQGYESGDPHDLMKSTPVCVRICVYVSE